MASKENWLKKLSVKEVCGKVEKVEEQTDLMTIMGIAHGTKIKTTTYGDSIGFVGDFEAINLRTGEVYRAPICYIPEPGCGMLDAALLKNDSVEFSFMIAVAPSAKSTTGYMYVCRPIVTGKQADALTSLREQTRAALPAPEKESKKAK